MDRSSDSSDALMIRESEMAERFCGFDWAATPLGPQATWPQSLRIAVGVCLNSRFPMFVWWGPDLINIYNDAYISVLGQRHPRAFGVRAESVWEEIWPDVGPQAEAAIQRGEATWNERVHLVMERNGFEEDTWFTWSYSPIPDEAGGIGGLFCACTEDTGHVLAERERSQFEAAARASEGRFREMADTAPAMLWVTDPIGYCTYLSRGWYEFTGQKESEGHGLGWTDAIHPDEREAAGKVFIAASDARSDYEIDFRLRRADGTYRWVIDAGRPYFDAEGVFRGFVGSVIDIHERKEAGESARRSTERFEIVKDVAEVGFWFCDLPFDKLEWDNQVKQHFWLAPESDVTIRTFYDQLHPDDRERTTFAIEKSIAERTPYEIEYRTVGPSQEVKWLRAVGRTFYGLDGEPIRFDGVTLDVTANKLAEEERLHLLESERAARTEAEHAGRMKDESLATLSHELRTPLNAILGYAQLLKMGRLGPTETGDSIAAVERNARLQAQMIEDLLDMNRIISGKVRLDLQSISLTDAIEAAVETVLPSIEAKEIRLQQILDPLAGPVRGDPARIQQVVWNLLSNAVKFTPKGGKIRILLERVNSHVEVMVSDSGEGISPDFLPHVFDRFRQADGSMTRRQGGLGLGLSIVRQLVELHGGSVRAKSARAGKGARFTVVLPVIHVDDCGKLDRMHPSAAATARSDGEMNLTGLRIFVVDDERDGCHAVKRLLEEHQAEVETAWSAAVGFEMLQDRKFDVLVSDIGMPAEDGYQFIRRVRTTEGINQEIPAVALTAFARSEDRRRSALSGFQNHLVKPVEAPELVAILASLTRRAGWS